MVKSGFGGLKRGFCGLKSGLRELACVNPTRKPIISKPCPSQRSAPVPQPECSRGYLFVDASTVTQRSEKLRSAARWGG